MARDLARLPLGHRWTRIGTGILAVSGVLCTFPNGGAFLGFCVLAVIAAGDDDAWSTGWVTVAAAVVSIECGALAFHVYANTGLGLSPGTGAGVRRRAQPSLLPPPGAAIGRADHVVGTVARHKNVRSWCSMSAHRIAREIHDVLAHSLGALGIHLQVIRAVLDEESSAHVHGTC